MISIPGQFVWNCWWTKWHWNKFTLNVFQFSLSMKAHRRCFHSERMPNNQHVWNTTHTPPHTHSPRVLFPGMCEPRISCHYSHGFDSGVTMICSQRRCFLCMRHSRSCNCSARSCEEHLKCIARSAWSNRYNANMTLLTRKVSCIGLVY